VAPRASDQDARSQIPAPGGKTFNVQIITDIRGEITHPSICGAPLFRRAQLHARRQQRRSRPDRLRGRNLAFVEVRTPTTREEFTALPELSVTTDKQRMVVRPAQHFLPNAMSSIAPTASMS